MANDNTASGISGVSVASIANPGTTRTAFTVAPNPVTLLPAAGTQAATIVLPPNAFDGKPFRLRATGRLTTGASMSVNVGLQLGSSATPGSNTDVSNPSAT